MIHYLFEYLFGLYQLYPMMFEFFVEHQLFLQQLLFQIVQYQIIVRFQQLLFQFLLLYLQAFQLLFPFFSGFCRFVFDRLSSAFEVFYRQPSFSDPKTSFQIEFGSSVECLVQFVLCRLKFLLHCLLHQFLQIRHLLLFLLL